MCKKLVDYRCKRLDKKGDICDRKLFEATDLSGVIHIQCPKCGKMNQIIPRKTINEATSLTVAHNLG